MSLEKSKFVTSAGVSNAKKGKISQITFMEYTAHIDKYLGFRMFNGRVQLNDFNTLLDRVNSKLADWKARLLNKPRRVILANYVLAAMPFYGMQVQWLPQSVCDSLDKIMRRFVWKGQGERGMQMVKWETPTRSRREWGVGHAPIACG